MIESLFVINEIQYTHQGLITKGQINKGTLIMSISAKQCLSINQLPQQFKQFIKNIELEDNQIALLLYLVHLKYINRTKNMLEPIISAYNFTYQRWLSSSTHGFCGFNEQVVRQSQDIDLLIQFLACQKYIREVSNKIYKLIFQKANQKNKWFPNQLTSQQWYQMIFWGMEFKNTRSFGYTKDTTLIPWFDYLNYSPSSEFQTQLKCLTGHQNQNICQSEEESNIKNTQFSEESSDSDNQSISYGNEIIREFALYSKRVIKQNQQIFINYGRRSNNYLLKWYGFTIKDNPYDYLKVYFDTFKGNSNDIRFDSLQKSYSMVKLRKNRLNYHLLSLMRKQYYSQYFGKLGKLIWSIPISLDYQLFIIKKVIDRIQKHQSKLPKGKWKDQQVKGVRWIKMYQEENILIYQTQISILYKLLNYINSIITHQSQDSLTILQIKMKDTICNIAEYLKCLNKVQQNILAQ